MAGTEPGSEGSAQGTPAQLGGAREVLELYPGAERLARQVDTLERAVDEASPLAVDLAKTLVETACKTILSDRGVPFSASAELQDLFRLTMQQLPLGGDTANGRVRDAVGTTLNGLLTAVRGLCELRNRAGLASHGQDAYARSLGATQNQLAARVADAIVCFLFKIHRAYVSPRPTERLRYDDHPEFNAYIDDAHDVAILGNPYNASEILFKVDPAAYAAELLEFLAQKAETPDED